jgi:hypothetical protein
MQYKSIQAYQKKYYTCSSLENTSKKYLSVDENLVVTEKRKTSLKKRETQVKSGAMKELINHLKSVLDKQLINIKNLKPTQTLEWVSWN